MLSPTSDPVRSSAGGHELSLRLYLTLFARRLKASSFKASRSQRRALAAFRTAIDAEPASSSPSGSSSKYSQPFDVVKAWQDIESEPVTSTSQDAKATHLERGRIALEWRRARKAGRADVPVAPTLPHVHPGKRSARLQVNAAHLRRSVAGALMLLAQVTLVPGRATKENFALFTRYQMGVHRESEDKVTRKGFERFLCQSPIQASRRNLVVSGLQLTPVCIAGAGQREDPGPSAPRVSLCVPCGAVAGRRLTSALQWTAS